MSKGIFGNFANLTSQTSTAGIDVSAIDADMAVVVGGTWVGTVQVDVSFDGSTWVTHPTLTGKTSPFSGAIGFRCLQMRVTCSAYSSGTIVSRYSGSNSDIKGS